MARNLHTTLGALALGAGLLVASAAPAAALTPPPDDDGPGFAPNNPLVSIGDTHAYESDGFIQFPLTLSKPSDQITFVTVQRSNDTTSNADFSGLVAPLAIFAPGTTTSTISFPLVDDDGLEDPEQMTAEITSVTGDLVVNDGTASGAIYDADGPVMGATMDQVDEGDPGDDVVLTVEVTLSYAAPEDISFTLSTQAVGFGAVPGEDFVPLEEIVVIPAGSTSVDVPIQVVSDDVVDDDDGVVMATASDPTQGTTWNNTAVGKILDDDTAGSGGSGDGTDDGGGAAPSDDPTTPTTAEADDRPVSASGELAAATRRDDGEGMGIPFLPIAAVIVATGLGWWLFARRSNEDDAPRPIDPTGPIHLD
jgi:hypothetical protein